MRLDPDPSARRPGRPRTAREVLAYLKEAVQAQLECQGWSAGEGAVHAALEGQYSLALVRQALRQLKAQRRAKQRRLAAQHRRHIEVHARDALWSMDATHLGRDAQGHALQAEVIREVASTRTIGLSVGAPATGACVVHLLDQTREERGTAPLVLASDNGPQYTAQDVARWCEQHGVMHLYSLPRTPQHNSWSEHGMRELKAETLLGKGCRVLDIAGAEADLHAARDRLDAHRLRKTRGWRTAVDFDRSLPPCTAFGNRDEILRAASCETRRALLHSTSKRAGRLAQREAILLTLQRFSIITPSRDGRSPAVQIEEDVS